MIKFLASIFILRFASREVESCKRDSECSNTQLCNLLSCVEMSVLKPCITKVDCHLGEQCRYRRCVVPLGVSTTPKPQKACRKDADCDITELCNFGNCYPMSELRDCTEDNQCSYYQRCSYRKCVAKAGYEEVPTTSASSTTTKQPGGKCSSDVDCASTELCSNYLCVEMNSLQACSKNDNTCSSGMACDYGRCRYKPTKSPSTTTTVTTAAASTTIASSASIPTSTETSTSTAAPGDCTGGKLTPEEREAVLNQHNDYRSQLVRGVAGHNAPGGNNVFELSYSCDLEVSAQNWAEGCKWDHSKISGVGENIFQSSGGNPTKEESLIAASQRWWRELADNDFQGETYVSGYSGPAGTLGHWSQMAWGATSKLGCGVAQCPFGTFVVCQYQEAGNLSGKKIYETGGSGCASDADCTSNKCNSSNGLCLK